MKKFLLFAFALVLFATTFAAPKRYKLLSSTSNWFNTANWSPAGLPSNGDTVTIPVNMQLTLSYDLTLQNFYLDIYGSLVLSGNNMRMIFQNTSTINVHTSGWINGSKASQQIVMGNTIIYKGNQGLLTGAAIVTSTTNVFKPYVENTVLPVKFLAFAVSRSGESVQVQWATAEETNSAYYEVQRSTDGANWKGIATQVAKNGSTNKYTYTGNAEGTALFYYRVKEVANDGSVTYTAIRMIKNTNAGQPAIATLQNNVSVVFTQPVTKATIEIIRLNGTVVVTKTIAAPIGTVQLSAPDLHGIYIVRVSNGYDLDTAKQVLL